MYSFSTSSEFIFILFLLFEFHLQRLFDSGLLFSQSFLHENHFSFEFLREPSQFIIHMIFKYLFLSRNVVFHLCHLQVNFLHRSAVLDHIELGRFRWFPSFFNQRLKMLLGLPNISNRLYMNTHVKLQQIFLLFNLKPESFLLLLNFLEFVFVVVLELLSENYEFIFTRSIV